MYLLKLQVMNHFIIYIKIISSIEMEYSDYQGFETLSEFNQANVNKLLDQIDDIYYPDRPENKLDYISISVIKTSDMFKRYFLNEIIDSITVINYDSETKEVIRLVKIINHFFDCVSPVSNKNPSNDSQISSDIKMKTIEDENAIYIIIDEPSPDFSYRIFQMIFL